MTKSVVVALAIVSLMPATAHGALIAAATPAFVAPSEGFSLAAIVDDSDRVLGSVDDPMTAWSDLPTAETVGFATGGFAVRQAGLAVRSAATFGPADASQEPLPEPATWLMMILGFFGLSFAVRRRSAETGGRVRFS